MSVTNKEKKPSRKHKNLVSRLELAEFAVRRYSDGKLTPMEMALKCDPKVLLKNWTETRDQLKQELLNNGE